MKLLLLLSYEKPKNRNVRPMHLSCAMHLSCVMFNLVLEFNGRHNDSKFYGH